MTHYHQNLIQVNKRSVNYKITVIENSHFIRIINCLLEIQLILLINWELFTNIIL